MQQGTGHVVGEHAALEQVEDVVVDLLDAGVVVVYTVDNDHLALLIAVDVEEVRVTPHRHDGGIHPVFEDAVLLDAEGLFHHRLWEAVASVLAIRGEGHQADRSDGVIDAFEYGFLDEHGETPK
ncbi:hypothetical protein D3C73_1283200 [compost metagenome]